MVPPKGTSKAGSVNGPRPSTQIDAAKVALLEEIDICGTISQAARKVGVSYRQAWNLLEQMNRAFLKPLSEAVVGGRQGGGAVLSDVGRQVVDTYRSMQQRADAVVAKEYLALKDLLAPEVHDLNLSARNTLSGKVLSIEHGEIILGKDI
jgi:molybdate transport system regulatory protein